MPGTTEPQLLDLKEKLLRMASHAEAAVNHSVKALLRRDDDLARRTREEDTIIDQLEKEVDEASLRLLEAKPALLELRTITLAMKIAHDLERVGDEATTISRRVLELSLEPPLAQAREIPRIATLALQMLKEAIDAFVHRDSARARAVVPQDKQVDRLHRELHATLAAQMNGQAEAILRCLHLMVISKSLERIGDHAANIAEMVVYMYEGRDIRHQSQPAPAPHPATAVTNPSDPSP